MKKIKSFTALVLALCFLSPSFFLACKEKPSPSLDSETSEETLPPSEEPDFSDTPEVSIPPESSSPPTPSPEETPSKPEEAPSTPVAPPVLAKAQYIKCTGDGVNIRAGASTDYGVVGSAEKGSMYAVIEKKGNWYKTYYKNKTAYVYASYASVFTIEKTEEQVEDVIEEGYKLLGVPYVYGAVRVHDGKGKLLGGFTTNKFDCSSLVQYIFYKGAGKLLGVHTRSQVLQGKYVKRSELQRGDCIFFTNESRQYNTGIERVGHVALYLGDGYILHTASDYARIEKISAKRWSFYIEARRFL